MRDISTPEADEAPSTRPQFTEEAEDEDTFTSLQLAASQGNVTLVSALLAHQTDPKESPKGCYGKRALQAASLEGHLPVVDVLLTYVDAPGRNNGGRIALTLAAGAGHLDIVDRLVAAGGDVTYPASRYMERTALQAAAEGGHLAVVRRLLDEGANVHAPPAHNNGRTAASCGGASAYQCCGDLDRRRSGGERNGHEVQDLDGVAGGCVCGQYRIDRDKGPAIRTLFGDCWVQVPILRRLLENQHRTPLQVAKSKGRTEIVEQLRKAEREASARRWLL
ncbi:MAG: hypothetical protein Q9187_004596 [Circinaria calcarea]